MFYASERSDMNSEEVTEYEMVRCWCCGGWINQEAPLSGGTETLVWDAEAAWDCQEAEQNNEAENLRS